MKPINGWLRTWEFSSFENALIYAQAIQNGMAYLVILECGKEVNIVWVKERKL